MDHPSRDYLKIIQITDTHLFADDSQNLFGINSNKQFFNLVDQIQQTELHDTDLILLTGDLSQDETPRSYSLLMQTLDPLNIPIYWIPGNHDDFNVMEKVFNQSNHFFHSRRLSTKHWTFIFLNTNQKGSAVGFLKSSELAALRQELINNEQKPIAIVMHHHPIKINTPLIDQYILENNEVFWDIVTSPPVKLIICGHVHNDYTLQHHTIQIESGPAACFQFPKQTQSLSIEEKSGCKIYHLHEDSCKTFVKWH